MSRDMKFYSAVPTVMHLSSLKTLSIFFVCEDVCSEKKNHEAKKRRRDYKNSLRPYSDSNSDPCNCFTLYYWDQSLYHRAFLSINAVDWPCR